MSEQIEHEIYSLAKTILDVAEKIDRKAKEAQSSEIQESLKELLKSFQTELSKGITDREQVLETLKGQKADIDKLDTIASKEVEKVPEQTQKLNREAVLKEARAEMLKAGFTQDSITKTQNAINKTFDELSKSLNMNDVLKETRRDMQAKGFDREVIERTEQAIKNTFTPNDSAVKEKSIFSSLTIRDPEEAFRNAIKAGLKNPGDYMYMNSEGRKDYFKHKETNSYKEFKISGESLIASPIMSRDEYLESESKKIKVQEDIKNISEADRIADIFGFDDPDNVLFINEDVTRENTLQPETSKGNELQREKGLTKVEFMENFREQLKNSQEFDKSVKGRIENILDSVTTKVISPDYGKPVEWAVAKTAKKNETLEQFKEYINNRKELNGKGKLSDTIKDAKEKTLEKQKETLEKRQHRDKTQSKAQQIKAR